MQTAFKSGEQDRFDQVQIDQYLRLFELGKSDKKSGELLRELVIEPNMSSMVHEFFGFLFRHTEFYQFIDGHDIDSLKKSMRSYLSQFGDGFNQAAYFTKIYNMGVIHASVGMPLKLFQFASHRLQMLIMSSIPSELEDNVVRDLQYFVTKIICLETLVVSEAFFNSDKTGRYFADAKGGVGSLAPRPGLDLDPLTSSVNRTQILAMLGERIQSADREGTTVPFLMFDIDGLSEINNIYGHLVGDQVLKTAIEKIRKNIQPDDCLGRFSGDEFIVLPGSSHFDYLTGVSKKISKIVEGLKFSVRETILKIRVTVVIATSQKDENINELLRRVDGAIIKKKAEKGNAG